MAFTDTQKKQLAQKLNRKHVRSRAIGNLSLSYIEGWHAIFEANRIFGFEGWDRETIDLSCIWQGNKGGEFACAYTTKVRITVRAGEGVFAGRVVVLVVQWRRSLERRTRGL